MKNRRKRIEALIVTPEEDQLGMLERYRDESGITADVPALWDSVLSEAEKKLMALGRTIEGELRLVYSHPRPVEITYLDTGDIEGIVTIPRLAIVGKVADSAGNTVTLSMVWVGRVFPQWRGHRISAS